jgi:hypothetical protein
MEHRWGERFPLNISIRLNAGTTVILGLRMSNASVSGGLLDTDVRLPVFSHVVVEFDVAGNSGPLKQHVPAYVVRHGHDGIGLEWQEFAPRAIIGLLEATLRATTPPGKHTLLALPPPTPPIMPITAGH